ncbi:MAG: hypothetical protein RL007_655 [Bacteroidota bacterium]|jgi:hypothetical protein
MKKLILFGALFGLAFNAEAKKVKFSVNMQGQVVDTGGVHITGDFQDEAGYVPGDWDPGSTEMFQELADTNIYSVIVDIPAFVKYEYKYVNGIHGYQQEFVPLESRVNYNFIDNRWVYLDSLSNDTLDIGAIRFGGNAPAGKNLVRFYVDMSLQTVSSNGVHVAGGFNNWDPSSCMMYSFDAVVYEYITYVDSGLTVAREHMFINGNTTGNTETLVTWCQNGNGYRETSTPADIMLPVVCYTFCDACSTTVVHENSALIFAAYPNPAIDVLNVSLQTAASYTLSIIDVTGREVYREAVAGRGILAINLTAFQSGTYLLTVTDNSGKTGTEKFIVQ